MGKHLTGDIAPVFVDEEGRRRRALGLAGLMLAAVLVLTIGAIGIAFAGGGSVPLPGLPASGDHHRPATGHLPPAVSPTPLVVGSTLPTPKPSKGATLPATTPTKPAGTAAANPTPSHPGNGHGQTVHPSHGPKN